MSVINQMLRDLDQRGHGLGAEAASPAVRSVAAPMLPPRQGTGSGRGRAVALSAGLLVALAAVWYAGVGDLLERGSATSFVSPNGAPETGAGAVAALSVPVSAASSVAEPVAALPAAVDVAAPPPIPLPGAPVQLRLDDALEHPPRPPAVPLRSAAPTPAVRANAVASAPSPAPVANIPPATAPVLERSTAPAAAASAPASVARSAETTPTPARQLAAAREALLHAQSLSAQGNQVGAVELLRDALPLAERNSAVAGMDAVVVVMVREMARIQLALGRVQETHDLLVQHEGRTRQIPEVWALRGNAAQRLGQHADSVQAYMQALQSRPTEQRWLLGLAVSLAAMGQTQAANSVVERASAEGPIARDIAAYLRQMGVVVR